MRWRTCSTRSTSILPWRSGKALRRNAARGDDAAIADPAALAQRLTEDVRAASHDGHFWMECQPERRDNVAFDKIERMPSNAGYSIHV
ncbi:hypothetical protein MUG10_19765 [Xanthomonas prunicola]|uniref:Uncharacterized protein n=1 Tax=Xanthomonas prunicola TaxID=2053930 RepID=A0A9Q9IY49_9XANT|nr:hypothetical protein [Xanthomonas prunicola]USJ00172.1 hypothetical protein MUG10_19765 [Xanthomonas prunicola]UXA48710.1 hypothetical protein M0D44_21025 [Xanthomonas prunicola]UXA57113.1 hypothetical protein M0D47_20665 [Xanthomonas prunicola]UXA63068.1 hypothetical protein M0D48_09080 [Xanthomonas prunicola]UXA65274.1 hypothetical protein M0D43_20745 [Xanthomonas prunicola]